MDWAFFFSQKVNINNKLNGVEKLVLYQAEMRKEGDPTMSVCNNPQEKIGANDPIQSIQLN